MQSHPYSDPKSVVRLGSFVSKDSAEMLAHNLDWIAIYKLALW